MTETEGIKIQTLSELKRKRQEIIDELSSAKANSSLLNRIAIWITNHVGSMGFFLLIFSWTILWLGWNIFAPKAMRFDPFPGFVLWLFISNMIQLFLMPLIMLGQNVQADHADSRAEADFKINAQAELENETIILHLEQQNALLLKMVKEMRKEAK